MKENIYDEEKFFEQYSRFPRSVQGLSAAGEWHELEKMIPNLDGKRVLDIGCGFGWHCIYAAEHGAQYVLGTDISQKMIAVAKEKTSSNRVEYQQLAMEDMDFPAGSFDVVLSSLVFHYTPHYKEVCSLVNQSLSVGGHFVFSVEHPIFTAQGAQDWSYDGDGKRRDWPVDNYFFEGARESVFLGEKVQKYHRTLTSYLNTLLQAGFEVTSIVEPQPSAHLLDTVEGMRDELRRPMMLLVSAKKM